MKLPLRRVRQPGLITVPPTPEAPRFSGRRPVRAIRRGVSILLWTLPMAALQAVMLLLPGRGKVVVARLYWASLCRLMGMQVRVIGTPARRLDSRPVVFASNHSSWLDILALGGTLEACFIAKQEVGRHGPLISTVAHGWGARCSSAAAAANTGPESAMPCGSGWTAATSLILFPEGTSSATAPACCRSARCSSPSSRSGTGSPRPRRAAGVGGIRPVGGAADGPG